MLAIRRCRKWLASQNLLILYAHYNHAIGSSDGWCAQRARRILIDYKNEEFDLVCGKACRDNFSDGKLEGDPFKLVREGNEMQRNLAHIFHDEDIVGGVWLIQNKGTTCYSSTIHATKYHYHVNVPQFEVWSFPTSWSLLGKKNFRFIGPLLAFQSSIEKLSIEKLSTVVDNKSKRPPMLVRSTKKIRNQLP